MHQLSEIVSAVLTHFCVALLSGYLSFSGFIAQIAQNTFVDTDQTEQSFVHTHPQTASESTPLTEISLSSLPTKYQIGGPIPRILLENAAYQQAAIAGIAIKAPTYTDVEHVADALVNVYCTYHKGEELHAVTGSGVFIDTQGIILTNAHVAQFLLLTQTRKDARCVIRQGNPAQEKYVADLLYISPAWIHQNASLIDAAAPSGTGERDYALLYVKKALSGTLPSSFPALPFDEAFLTKNTVPRSVLAAGYPALLFEKEGPETKLIPRVASTTIAQLFTFNSGKADVLALHGSAVGEQGSSGGPILSPKGEIIGLIVTKGDEKDGERSLRAITLAYINQTILEETGFDLRTTLRGNLPRRSEIFKQALIPFLSSLLETELR